MTLILRKLLASSTYAISATLESLVYYQQCRTAEQIQFEFDQLQHELEKDALLDEISRRLEQRIEQEPLFALHWHLA